MAALVARKKAAAAALSAEGPLPEGSHLSPVDFAAEGLRLRAAMAQAVAAEK